MLAEGWCGWRDCGELLRGVGHPRRGRIVTARSSPPRGMTTALGTRDAAPALARGHPGGDRPAPGAVGRRRRALRQGGGRGAHPRRLRGRGLPDPHHGYAGQAGVHPMIRAIRDGEREAAELGDRLGLPPAARKRFCVTSADRAGPARRRTAATGPSDRSGRSADKRRPGVWIRGAVTPARGLRRAGAPAGSRPGRRWPERRWSSDSRETTPGRVRARRLDPYAALACPVETQVREPPEALEDAIRTSG